MPVMVSPPECPRGARGGLAVQLVSAAYSRSSVSTEPVGNAGGPSGAGSVPFSTVEGARPAARNANFLNPAWLYSGTMCSSPLQLERVPLRVTRDRAPVRGGEFPRLLRHRCPPSWLA